MNYVTIVCRCCKGKWRVRIQIPEGGPYILSTDSICHRCNLGECSRPDDDLHARAGCNEGRK